MKAIEKPTFKVSYWRQLIGYLVLADSHTTLYDCGIYDRIGLTDDPDVQRLPEIDAFGVYFARHGEVSTVPASVVYEADVFSEFRSWFVKTALDQYDPFDAPLDDIVRQLF